MLCHFLSTVTATPDIYTLSLHDALPISQDFHGAQLAHLISRIKNELRAAFRPGGTFFGGRLLFLCAKSNERSEEHTSELQSLRHLVCRLLLEKKKKEI